MFLGQSIDAIWQRLQAQPSTYVFSTEEFAAFSYYRGVFNDNEIAQQALRRFWERYGAKSTGTEEEGRHSPTVTSGPAVSQVSAVACQRCRARKVKCDKKKPACTPCDRAGRRAACTYTKEMKGESFAEPCNDVDESKVYHEMTPRSTLLGYYKGLVDGVKVREDLIKTLPKTNLRMPKGSQTERHRIRVLVDSIIEREDKPTPQTGKVDQQHFEPPKTLPVDLGRFRMHVMNGKEHNLVNSAKLWLQRLTGETWDWWPLRPSFRPLLEDEIRLRWHCVLGHEHWTVLPNTGPAPSPEAVKSKQSAPSSGKDSGTSTSRSSGSESSVGRSSPAVSDNGTSDQPDDEADSGKDIHTPGTSIEVDIMPPSDLTGFVLFGVHGSKRLQSAWLRLAQIDVAIYKDDDSFFDEMSVQYMKLRGFLRRVLSIWVFYTCDFIMFHKANPNEIMPGPEEVPSPENRDYEYHGSRNPPVLSTVFNAKFYGCNKACIKSQLDLLCIFHECKSRNHCGKYRVLERLPKRRRKWDVDRDEEKDEAWGLNAVFAVSFYKVLLYHTLILAGPIVFWGLWLKAWPTDWQNASVPFFAVVVLLSLFWLPFAHNESPADRNRRSKNKSN